MLDIKQNKKGCEDIVNTKVESIRQSIFTCYLKYSNQRNLFADVCINNFFKKKNLQKFTFDKN